MTLKPYQQKIVDLMTAQELKIAEIYLLFSKRYPEMKDFWITLHQEELEHAQWIEHLANKANREGMQFHEDKIRTYTVQSFVEYLTGLHKKIKNERLSLAEAVSLAVGLEEALLERKVFQHYDGDSAEINKLLVRLREETARHAARVQELRQETIRNGTVSA